MSDNVTMVTVSMVNGSAPVSSTGKPITFVAIFFIVFIFRILMIEDNRHPLQ